MTAALVPELYVSDFSQSFEFYRKLGFQSAYAREAERFAYLRREDAELMIEEPIGRTWLAADLIAPFGRGINFQIAVTDASALYEAVKAARIPAFLAIECRQYVRKHDIVEVRQFVVADPDGYLLRFCQTIGSRMKDV